jgi:hypothetical protein
MGHEGCEAVYELDTGRVRFLEPEPPAAPAVHR